MIPMFNPAHIVELSNGLHIRFGICHVEEASDKASLMALDELKARKDECKKVIFSAGESMTVPCYTSPLQLH